MSSRRAIGAWQMQEVLSRNRDSSQLPDGEEFIELVLSDTGPDDEYPSFLVMETVARWDAPNEKIVSDAPQFYPFKTLEDARSRYEERRLVLVRQGFVYSDMDW